MVDIMKSKTYTLSMSKTLPLRVTVLLRDLREGAVDVGDERVISACDRAMNGDEVALAFCLDFHAQMEDECVEECS